MPPTPIEAERAAFVDRLLESTAGTFRVFTIFIGHRLGLYRALSEGGPATAPALAERTRTNERYVREWLEQQTVAGVLRCENPDAAAMERRFALPPGHAEVLVDEESLDYLAPLVQLLVGATRPVVDVVEAFRSGGGVAYGSFGEDLVAGQAGMNRAMFLKLLPTEWIATMPDVKARLEREPPARVADVGCGAGWSAIGLAKAYPRIRVHGLDLDKPSIELARRNAEDAGLADRVTFEARDAADPKLQGQYDLVAAFECIHDMSRPVDALRAMRGLVAPGGAVLVVDERVGNAFTPQGRDFEWMMYGWSVLHCLPSGMAEQPSAATGAVMRPPTLKAYAVEAGFRDVEILPAENPFFRLYRLLP